MPEIILHHYEFSPYSEKVRLAFGLKRLPWRSVSVPVWMPKPELMPLTGGYRRAPVMQIGADVYCDTNLMLRVLERLRPEPSLYPGGTQGLASALAWWWESNTFLTAARILGGMIGEKLPPELVEDRKTFLGFDMGRAAMAPELPLHVGRLRAHFHWLERMFGDGRPFVLGDAPGAADLSAYHIIWLLRRNLGAEIDALVPFERLDAWYGRVGAVGHGSPRDMPAAEALDVAAAAAPEPPDVAPEDGEAFGLSPGRRVSVTPDDTGRDPVVGTLVAAGAEEIVLRRADPRVGEVNVHFPRAGYDAVPA
jgi:glutathione S-transferase